MTFGQYKRLLLVVAVPLILSGVAFAEVIRPYPHNFLVLQCQRSPDSEYCREFGDISGNLYESVKKQSSAWFDVEDAPVKKPSMTYLASADIRALKAQVVSAVPFSLSSPTAEADMNKLVGKNVDIILGIEANQRSSIVADSILLRCNSVRYLTDGKYRSQCYGDNWSGNVTYSAASDGVAMLQRLRDAVNTKITDWQNDHLLYRVVCYSMFLVGFLLLSGIVWLVRRATTYVKAG